MPLNAALCSITALAHALGRNAIVGSLCFPGNMVPSLLFPSIYKTVQLIRKVPRLIRVQMGICIKCWLDFLVPKSF